MAWADDIKQAMTNLGGQASLAKIYDEIRRIRPGPHTEHIEASVRRTIEQNSSDSAAFSGNDLFYSVNGVGAGIWGLRSFAEKTPQASDLDQSTGVEVPIRVLQETYRVLRDTLLVRQLKSLHQNRCQLCGESILLPNGDYYSEGHHLKPLGRPHNGPDLSGNILVLCPNHHVMLDYGVIALKTSDILVHARHRLDAVYLSYHNEKIYKSSGRNPS